MEFRTLVDIPPSSWQLSPCERMLFVGSCFADNMGRRFTEEKFRAVVNPFGVMYNPASILHTVVRLQDAAEASASMPFREDEDGTAVFTLGTNHVYILKETGEIVDNCQKRPQSLFQEKELTVDECASYMRQAIDLIHSRYPRVRFIITVSPIRYRKYGYHGSQLSKATLMLAIQSLTNSYSQSAGVSQPASPHPQISYFPSYEIMNDELRDYRFYKPDMLHPSDQAVEYIYERMAATFFSPATHAFLKEWKPIRAALAHRPFNPDSEEHKVFMERTKAQLRALTDKYPCLEFSS